MESDWSQLPKDLLQIIYKKLNTDFYQLRFRSVCSSWRSSFPKFIPKPLSPPRYLSLSPPPYNYNPTFKAKTLFLIFPPQHHNNNNNNNHQTLKPWLIKIDQSSPHRIRLFHPLSRDKPLTLNSHVFDFNQHTVFHLGTVVTDFPCQYTYMSNNNNKVVVVVYHTLPLGNGNENDRGSFALLTIYVNGELVIFRQCDPHWTTIPQTGTLMPFHDVSVFNGRFIAVDSTGRTVAVRPEDLSLDLVAVGDAVLGGDKKFLVESDGELLLVDKYSRYFDDSGWSTCEMMMKFNVFRLDEKEKKWVEVRNLGDKVLFLGEDCAFSVSIGNGNRVVFMGRGFRNVHYTVDGIYVFNMDQRRVSHLSNDSPCYSELFWPPPEWVGLRVDNTRNLLFF